MTVKSLVTPFQRGPSASLHGTSKKRPAARVVAPVTMTDAFAHRTNRPKPSGGFFTSREVGLKK